MFVKLAVGQDVQHTPILPRQFIGDEATVAAKIQRLGAEKRRRLLTAQ